MFSTLSLAFLSNIGLGWTIAIVVGVVALVLFIMNKNYTKSKKTAYLKRYNLPKDWNPPEYYGPERTPDKVKKTPKRIKVYAKGFDRNDIPEYSAKDHKYRVRINYDRIDEIWAETKNRIVNNTPERLQTLTKQQKKTIENLSADYPIVEIWSTIQWYEDLGTYVQGLTPWHPGNKAQVTVYYKTVTSGKLSNWESILSWEFTNVCLIACGRMDLAY